MANLTIAVDGEVLRRARMRAAEQGTSVNAVLRSELERYAESTDNARATEAFLAFARQSAGRGGGRTWTREELWTQRADRA